VIAPAQPGVMAVDPVTAQVGDYASVIAFAMAQIIVRQLDDATKEALQRLARRHGRSAEAEAREILRNAVRHVDDPPGRLGSAIAALFAGAGLTEDIAELRGQNVRAAEFDE